MNRTFLWDDVQSAEMGRHGDADLARREADAVVAHWTRGLQWKRRAWLRWTGRAVKEWCWPLVALAAIGAIVGVALTSGPGPKLYAGVSERYAVRQGEDYAQDWWFSNLRLVSVAKTHRGAAPFWRLVYRDIGGQRVCVDVNKNVYYVGACA